MFEPIELLTRVYAPVESREAWLRGVYEPLKALPGIFGFIGYTVRFGHGVPEGFVGDGVDQDVAARAIVQGAALPERKKVVAGITRLGLFSGIDLFGRRAFAFDAQDAYALAFPDGEESFNVIVGYSNARVVNDEPPMWRHVALHLGAGARLLRQAGTLEDAEVEAVFEADGTAAHLNGTEVEENREQIRAAILDIDRARSRGGAKDAREALALWPGLILGRWSLVDHFDSDGRRYVVARRNDPSSPTQGQLSRRERQVAFYAGLGLPYKTIGYALGIGVSTVSYHVEKAMVKLGVKNHAELIELAARLGPSAPR